MMSALPSGSCARTRGLPRLRSSRSALGIGAAAAMFGLIQGVLLSPPPYADPGRLVARHAGASRWRPYNARSDHRPVDRVARRRRRSSRRPSIAGRSTSSILSDGSQSIGGMVVTPDYFRVLGVRPILGREFTDAELQPAERAADGHHHRPRPVAAAVQRRSGHHRHRRCASAGCRRRCRSSA